MKDIFLNTWQIIREKAQNKYWLVPFCLLVLCIIDTIASLFNTGFVKVDALFIVLLLAKAGVLVYNVYIFWNLFIKARLQHYHIFKTYTGYAVVFIYVFYSLPRLAWETQGLITGGDSLRLWIFTMISSFLVFCLYWSLRFARTQLAWGMLTEREYKERKDKKKQKQKEKQRKKSVKEHIIENVHVVIQAIITVIIIQHFTFQLYEIPSESMVPTFLMKDRVFVTKFQYGPTLPLTNWHLPSLTKLKRGDVVVFESPEYSQDNVIKRIFHQFVFYLTLSKVNIDKDENGQTRKQLIVKRLVGMPGEKLKMIDDVLYVKRLADKEFTVMEEDKNFSNVDLYDLDPMTLSKIDDKPVSRDRREILNKWDAWKKAISLADLNSQLNAQAARIAENFKQIDPAEVAVYFEKLFSIIQPDYKNNTVRMENFHNSHNIGFFCDIGTLNGNLPIENQMEVNKLGYYRTNWGYDLFLFWKLLKEPKMVQPLQDFLLSTITKTDKSKLDDYELNLRKLNIKFKLMLAERFNSYLDLYLNNIEVNDAKNRLTILFSQAECGELFLYTQFHFDNRNFPEYPTGEQYYIPDGNYFLMGDNRYNSLDFRFSHDPNVPGFKALDKTDPYSVVYQSHLQPYLLERAKILGTGKLRIWPLNRIGVF